MTLAKTKAQGQPDDFTGLKLWLDADDLTNLYQNTACSTSVTATGQDVGCWLDKSGNNAHVTAPNGLPTYRTNQFNGLPALEFVAAETDWLNRTLSVNSWNSDYTVFIVFQQTNSTLSTTSPFFANGNSSTDDYFQIDHRAGYFNWLSGSSSNIVKALFEPGDTKLNLYTAHHDATTVNISVNCKLSDTVNTEFGKNFDAYKIDRNRVSTALADAKIAEVIIYDRALNDTEQTSLNIYLENKYGVDCGLTSIGRGVLLLVGWLNILNQPI